MNKQENEVMENLVKAWNGFLELKRQHNDEVSEFRHAIHICQGIIALRIVGRDYPNEFYNQKG